LRGFDAQLASRITVLKKIVDSGTVRWRTIIADTEQRTGSAKISQASLDWLLAGSHVRRISRGVYEATEKGVRLAEYAPTGGVQG